jgi:hypothetical protein
LANEAVATAKDTKKKKHEPLMLRALIKDKEE